MLRRHEACLGQGAKYDPLADFTPIALVGQSPLIVVVPASKPFMTVKELDAYLKANGSRASYASSGPAGITQFGAEVYLERAGDLAVVHVPYIEVYALATPAETGAYLERDVERFRSFRSELGDRLTK